VNPGPWTPAQTAATVAVNAIGALAIVIGTAVAASDSTLRAQGPWIDVAVAGLLLAGVANGALLAAARRALAERRRELLEPMLVREPNA